MKRQAVILLALLCFGIIGVVSTYTRLSTTADEFFHVWCGTEWWESWSYTREALHPPLARIMAAALPYFFHVDANPDQLSPAGLYIHKLVLMRLGILPFYIFSCLLVFSWSKKLYGRTAALWSLALYVTLSTITAHAGLATTDMGAATMLVWGLFTTLEWLEKPTAEKSVVMGISIGLMVGTKFSALAQFPSAMLLILAAQAYNNYKGAIPVSPVRPAHIKTGILLVLPWAFIVLGLLYHFNFQSIGDGLAAVHTLDKNGFAIWMFGPLGNHAVWYFFPVIFFFKTPLPFHAAWILGNTRIAHETRKGAPLERIFPLLAAAGILFISTASHINLGVRHVLPIYPLLAVPAGYGMSWLWKSGQENRFIAVMLILWQAFGFIRAYPEHIAYFNELAGSHPEHISIDSDFDWGQGMVLLSEAVQKLPIDKLSVCVRNDPEYTWGLKDLTAIPILPCPENYAEGWVAVGISDRLLNPDKFTWLSGNQPVQIVGKTLELYHLPAK